jgi:dTDP-4-amino-4,6-dideoxygalactose transaminase
MKTMFPVIPQCNPKANYLSHKSEIDMAIDRVLNSGWYILGKEVELFEKEFADYIGVGFGIATGSGTEALHLALRACDISDGDEVITVSHTAVATVAAIELCGAKPVLADIDLNTYTMDTSQIEQLITKQTKAIIPVHLYGHPADMDNIKSIADRHGLKVIEDCAQSAGAIYKERKTGALGHIATFSFYPTKNLGAVGDGGIVVTDDPQLAEQVRLLRQYGWQQRYISEVPGLNSRLDELQATILRAKLPHLDEENQKRRNLAATYDKMLSSTELILPVCLPNVTHVYHQYVIRSKSRDAFREFLQTKGVGTLIHYPVPIHKQPAYLNRLRCANSMENTEKTSQEILSLPIYPELSLEQTCRLIEIIVSWRSSQKGVKY